MSVIIEIPTAFRRFTEGAPRIDCSAATVAAALNELTARFPALSRHVRDDSGQIRQFLNIYLNDEDIRFLGGESSPLKEGDRVLLVPSIAGGCPGGRYFRRLIVPRHLREPHRQVTGFGEGPKL
jgi:molybdopterin synthase sulfur carrier subunit